MAEEFQLSDIEAQLEQAQAVASGLLNSQYSDSESVERALEIVKACVVVLDKCVQVLGGSDVEVIASFPEGRRSIVNFSR